MAKERVLVMNGSRLLEQEVGAKWAVKEVKPAEGLKPGIYNIYNATQADKTKAEEGVVLHADDKSLYQMTGKDKFVKHNVADLETVPSIGVNVSISYSEGRGSSKLASSESRSRGR